MHNGKSLDINENPDKTADSFRAIENLDNRKVDSSEKNGFEIYEEKYHHRMDDFSSEKYEKETIKPEDLNKIFEINGSEIEETGKKIDTYIYNQIKKCEDISKADIEDIFNPEDFIEVLKTCSPDTVLPAVVYWNAMKESFEANQLQDKTGLNLEISGGTISQEKRVRVVKECLKLSPLYISLPLFGYSFVTGKDSEQVLTKASEVILEASDATLYLAGCAITGCAEFAENGINYGRTTVAYLSGHKEYAEVIMKSDFSGKMKGELDKVYGRDNWAKAIGTSVEKFGYMATYLGLEALLTKGSLTAVGAGTGIVLAKAGEKTKSDIQKTGKLSEKEIGHGLVAGITTLACAEIRNAGVDALSDYSPKIAQEIKDVVGERIDAKTLKELTASIVNGLEAGLTTLSCEIPDEISGELERALEIDPNMKGQWAKVLKDTSIAFGTAAVVTFVRELYENEGFYSKYEDRIQQTPTNNGEWTGERGESKFISKDASVNNLLQKEGLDGIEYKNGIPDFSAMSKGTVEIENMTGQRRGRGGNFEQAIEKLSDEKGYSPGEIATWMDKNNYVWHECNDMRTMQKIPFVINHKFGHLGGVGECNKREELLNSILGGTQEEGGVFDV